MYSQIDRHNYDGEKMAIQLTSFVGPYPPTRFKMQPVNEYLSELSMNISQNPQVLGTSLSIYKVS